MNLNLLNPTNHGYINVFINNMFECNMKPLITKPTKGNLDNPITRFSVLDQIWVSNDLTNTQSFIIPNEITDHFPICVLISSFSLNQTTITVKMRKFAAMGKETFKLLLSNIHVSLNFEDMNTLYENYHNLITEIYNLAFPIVTTSLKYKNQVPWMSHKLRECIKKK